MTQPEVKRAITAHVKDIPYDTIMKDEEHGDVFTYSMATHERINLRPTQFTNWYKGFPQGYDGPAYNYHISWLEDIEEGEEVEVPVMGSRGDAFQQEVLGTIHAAEQYLMDRMGDDDFDKLVDFIEEVYEDDTEIYGGVKWGVLVGIGLMLQRRLE